MIHLHFSDKEAACLSMNMTKFCLLIEFPDLLAMYVCICSTCRSVCSKKGQIIETLFRLRSGKIIYLRSGAKVYTCACGLTWARKCRYSNPTA